MARDVRDLLHDAVPGPVGEPDLDAIEARAARRRTVRVAAVAAVLVGAVAVGAGMLSTLAGPAVPPIVDAPPTVVDTPTQEPTTGPTAVPSATEDADGAWPGDRLMLDALPAMGTYGVAVQTEQGVVFVGVDGGGYGALEGYELASGSPADDVPGLVRVVPADDPGGLGTWVDAASGTTLPGSAGIPVGYSALLVAPPSMFDPGTYELRGAGHEVSFSTMTGWSVSAGHRTLTWLDCPRGVDDLGDAPSSPECLSRFVDLDMGGEGELEPGCWASDEFGDLNQIRTCSRWWSDGTSWLEVSQVGQEERVDLPAGLPDGAHFTEAYFGDGIVAEIAFPDGTATVGAYRDGEWQELLPMPDLHPMRLLGVAREGQDVRTLVVVEADGDRGGVWAVDADGASRLVPVVPQAAQMWTGAFDLDAAAAHAITVSEPGDREGWTFGFVRGADLTAGTITIDEAEWLTGEEARAAHEAETGDPDGPPNDYVVRNADTAESTYPVADGATIRVMDPADVSTLVEGDLADVQETVERFEDWALYWLRIEDGVVTAVEWQYTP